MHKRPPRLGAGGWRGAGGAACCVALAGIVLLGTSGCVDPPARANPTHGPTTEPPPVPAFEAGGACQLIDYEVINRTVGIGFAVAAAAQQGETYTCVVQTRRGSYPDLTLSVSASTADVKVFRAAVMPTSASTIADLGRAAYSIPVAAKGEAGPGVEVGWLTGNERLMVLRLRLPPQATPEEAAASGPKLIELARYIDITSV